MSKEKAREHFVKGCNEYLRLFCEKHDFDYEEAKESWVGGLVGEVTLCGDYYVTMPTIITDIEMDAPEEEFIKWYDYNLVANHFGFATPNFDSWLRGCPRVSDEAFKKLQALKDDLDNAILEEQAKLNK
jgi:hypothetical protein